MNYNIKTLLILMLIGFVFLFGFILGTINGEYIEMKYINKVINDVAYSNQSNLLKNDFGIFYIQPLNNNFSNFSLIK